MTKTKTSKHRDISTVVRDGELTFPQEHGRGEIFTYEVMPGRPILVELFRDKSCGLREPGSPACFYMTSLPQVSLPGYARALPALLELMSAITFCEDMELQPIQEYEYRLETGKLIMSGWTSAVRSDMRAEDFRSLTGEQILFLGFLDPLPGATFREELERAAGFAAIMRSCYIPPGYLGLNGRPGFMAGIPEQFRGIAAEFGRETVAHNLARAQLLVDLLAFAAGGKDHHTLGTMRERSSATTRATLSSHNFRQKFARRSFLLPAEWEDKEWWAHIPDHMFPVLDEFLPEQVVALLDRGHACGQTGALRILLREIANGNVRQFPDFEGGCGCGVDFILDDLGVPWCSDRGLADWVHNMLIRELGFTEAHRLLTSASEASLGAGVCVGAAAWDHFIRNYEELKDMPVSWWAALGEE